MVIFQVREIELSYRTVMRVGVAELLSQLAAFRRIHTEWLLIKKLLGKHADQSAVTKPHHDLLL